jgi:hypothetical protein
MNATQWRRIALFVEGEEDRAFAERVLKPRLLQQYSEVRVHMHAQTPDEKLSSHFRSLQRMNSDTNRQDTNRQAKVHKKQQLMTPSLRFPLQAGGTE